MFDILINFAILMNTVVMAMRYFNMNDLYSNFLDIANYIFTAIFTCEAIIKIIAQGHHYFMDNWNRFDFITVSGTLIGIILTSINSFNLSTTASAV